MAPPRVPTKWTFQPYFIVTRNDDGTFKVSTDWEDSYQYAYDVSGDDITDVREIGSTLMNAWINDRFGGYQACVEESFLPDGWVEPETEEEKRRREMLVELQEISAALSAATSNCHTSEG